MIEVAPDRFDWKPAALIVALVLIAYFRVFTAGFIWDDPQYVVNNFELRDWTGLFNIWFHPTTLPQWYPLVHTTFWIEYHLWGVAPAGYHIVNVALHCANAILAWRLLKSLRVPGAWLAAAIFAVHPVGVESVAWVTERKNVLSLFFYLLALWIYLSKPSPRGWVFAFTFFVCAPLSKSVTATLPAAILVIQWWKSGRMTWRDLQPLLPFFVAGMAMGLWTSYLEVHHVGADGSKIAELNFTIVQRVFIAGPAIWFYAAKILVPTNLTFIYPRWSSIDHSQLWLVVFPLAIVALIVALWMLRNRIGRGPLGAVLLYCGTLFPALGFANVYPMRFSFVADHFQYHASIALIALFAAIIRRIACPSHRAFDPTFITVRALILAALVGLTIHQTRIYANAETLWRDTLAKNPDSWMAHTNLGNELIAHNNIDAAAEQYFAALKLAPNLFDTHVAVGNIYGQRGDFDRAVAEFEKAIALNKDFAPAYYGWGQVLEKQNRFDEAFAKYSDALTRAPNYPQANFRAGFMLEKRGQYDEALDRYRKAVTYAPEDFDARYTLGTLLLRTGQFDEAVFNLLQAVHIDPQKAEAWTNLGAAQMQSGHPANAVKSFQTALRLKPSFAPATAGLARAQSMLR